MKDTLGVQLSVDITWMCDECSEHVATLRTEELMNIIEDHIKNNYTGAGKVKYKINEYIDEDEWMDYVDDE